MTDEERGFLDMLADPPMSCRPGMFWLLNGRLTPERIRDQIQQMHERGCGAFLMQPMGESFRLGDFIQGIDPPYLSDGYFEMIRYAVQVAQELGMCAWLYDEGGWPSGTAQGRVIEGHPELRAQVLRPGEGGRRVARASVGGRRLHFSVHELERPDHLNPESARRFIELTHERYAEHVGEFFGGTIPGIFTDETAVPGRVGGTEIPWTEGMMEKFERAAGYELEPWLPVLFSDEALGLVLDEHFDPADIAAVRCELCELWTDLFEEAYWRQISDWCAAHDLIHTGHVGGEDQLASHAASFGHFFKTAGALQAPGVDAIWRQLFPGADNFCFPLLASSAVGQRADRNLPGGGQWDGLAITESFAVYGLGLTPEQMRWLADYQAMCGINYLTAMALYYETSGGRFVGAMSHLGDGNPLWDYFDSVADHVATMSAAVRFSEPVVTVAVYWPAEAAWLGGEACEAAWTSL
ncbi:MAG TPA: hypothetical protein VM283_08470, partial [Armatimonadota bacterium]|nr:hypothetical protein [Armatimonadota bacterium]